MVEIVKQEMTLINDVDKPGSDIDMYVKSLDKILQEKEERIRKVREKLFKFNKILREEEFLSQKYNQAQNELDDISPILGKNGNLLDNEDFLQYK